MDFLVVQFLTGLASACSLFLVASGLSLIFGVTRIVNFAHGAFYMVGAYVAYVLTERWSGALGYWGGLLCAALVVGAAGAAMEMALLRRIYRAPDLFQLLATFGVTLMVEDLVVLLFGPEDLLGARAPGFKGAVEILGQQVPRYDLFLIGLAPLVLAGLHLVLRRTRWGILVRAATQDREMVAALGVNQRWLFTSVFALGTALAGLGGALQLPREAVNHSMDMTIIVEAFVVVVIGGLGSITGAFLAAVLVCELNAFGILVLPEVSLVLVFAVMAGVLILRPHGLLGGAPAEARAMRLAIPPPWKPFTSAERLWVVGGLALAAALPLVAGAYALTVAAEVAIFALFAASLSFLMGPGGMPSFGHAAFFGLGAYGAALAVSGAGLPMAAALLVGPLLGLAGAVLFGWFCVRLSGVYSAMLTLAFAQIAWAVAFQWVGLTGGDNGLLGIWPEGFARTPHGFYWLALAICATGIVLLRILVFSRFGYRLRAARDSAARAETVGIDRMRVQWAAFAVAGLFAAIAGALFAFLKGSVFPDTLGIPLSVDALAMVLLGGVETVSGAILGAIAYKLLAVWLISETDQSKLVLGAVIVLLVVVFPQGLGGQITRWRRPT
ncbi:ABC transporter permease [Aquabacter spiritensis]|uniref:Amino acid/amide ABC transporter membrane protein 1 (HAAT family) /amino acid/amide ABC transporter membrane protein 2 (HAAT family) n=1 Tax=Aquabacter spiritensis TaxID=933073 RepID=A0A4R3LZ22_9HYPH|nr:ABC transporter permease [Aquabacter spiritensis]TCT05119.1 amino acid/amide ABC transporter membrane protein 1 (HAAT family) /amino acid/amide ABC transporter membrane protein 2 (HAAT family) [Aquabacter spiritensis]